MDIITIKFLFSVAFILIGSLTFHISALVSGHNIYRDHSIQESSLLSIVVGIVIFLLSPISYIILPNSNADFTYTGVLFNILKFKVLFSFFGAAFGLGLIFGGCTIAQMRSNVLSWFREKSKLRFWIYSYGNVWDDFLSSVQRDGEVTIQTDDAIFEGLLGQFSIKNETRELVLNKCKIIAEDVYKKDMKQSIECNEIVNVLIPGSKIKKIIVPERSFKKHFESMEHISQAFYYIISTIGLLLLSCSAYLTGNYLLKEFENLEPFYSCFSLVFSSLAFLIPIISVFIAKEDFNNFNSFLMLSPYIAYIAIFLSSIVLFFILFLIQVIQSIETSIILILLSFLITHIFLKYKYKNANADLNKIFDGIKKDFDDDRMLEGVIQNCNLQLSCINKEKAHIDAIKKEVIERYDNDVKIAILLKSLDKKLADLKGQWEYLENEDINILFKFEKYLTS